MKKTILILYFIFTGVWVYSQHISESDVPLNLKEKFKNLYPDHTIRAWEKEDGNYRAEFKASKGLFWITIGPAGNLVNTKTQILVSELPSAANSYIATISATNRITETFRMTNDNGIVTYIAEIKDSVLLFDSSGKFIP